VLNVDGLLIRKDDELELVNHLVHGAFFRLVVYFICFEIAAVAEEK